VTKGSISVDGHDIRQLSRQDYRKQFGMVLQDAWLYEGTIKENLRFGNLDATDEEIIEKLIPKFCFHLTDKQIPLLRKSAKRAIARK